MRAVDRIKYALRNCNIETLPFTVINSIPHKNQRYDTVGDWQETFSGRPGEFLRFKISRMNLISEFAVLIHEMIEWFFCKLAGITSEQVDAWDMGEGKDLDDPGSDPRAPYHLQHMFALQVERMIVEQAGITWEIHEEALDNVGQEDADLHDQG